MLETGGYWSINTVGIQIGCEGGNAIGTFSGTGTLNATGYFNVAVSGAVGSTATIEDHVTVNAGNFQVGDQNTISYATLKGNAAMTLPPSAASASGAAWRAAIANWT